MQKCKQNLFMNYDEACEDEHFNFSVSVAVPFRDRNEINHKISEDIKVLKTQGRW